jgi:ABC-2 type transport system ATP-binding protein
MVSVEEMCDEIALIDKSNKILDGKLVDIKRAFRTHTFQVGLKTANAKEVENMLKENFKVFPADFELLNEGLALNVQLNATENTNDLLSFLTSRGEVQHFVEVMPSANDIFIQAIDKNSKL